MSNFFKLIVLAFLVLTFSGMSCAKAQLADTSAAPPQTAETPVVQNPGRVVHVLVALCDNVNQGIVPVPAAIGNGDDPPKKSLLGRGVWNKNFLFQVEELDQAC